MTCCKMAIALILVVSLVTVSRGDITGTDQANGACLCFNGNSVNIRSSGASGNEYTCDVINEGKRVHETTSSTPFDCKDSGCLNTCKGGQCVAYVTCNCKRNGKWAPNTRCWRPGQKLKTSDGKCNRNIAANTAIATFNAKGNYYAGHAAVFIKCEDDYTILVYDQWCCRSVGYSRYGSSHSYFGAFATITSPDCSDRGSWPCRVEDSGATCCKASSGCP